MNSTINLWRIVLTGLMWMGLLLCTIAAIHYWPESRQVLHGLRSGTVVLLVGLLVLLWIVGVVVWRQIVLAYDTKPMPWSVAARHLALLLLGKYLPGGFWGFSARLADSSQGGPIAPMLAAGLAEQWLGLFTLASLAALGLLSVQMEYVGWLLLALFIPVGSVCTLALGFAIGTRLGALVMPRWQLDRLANRTMGSVRIWMAAVLVLAQQSLVIALVTMVAMPAFGLPLIVGVGVASSYALAVAAGIAAIFVPGGIVVREVVFVSISSRWLMHEQAIALAASLRLMFTMLDLMAGTLAAGLHFRRGEKHA
jgi:glycosyltransferase 2 family protein